MSVVTGEHGGGKEEATSEKGSVSPTLLSSVTTALEEAIVRGEFPPGCTLREVFLVSRFKASRGTIREALRALSEQGLVEMHSRRGAAVPQLSLQRAREIFSLRAVLESFAVKLALTEGRIRDLERERIQRAFDHMKRCVAAGEVAALVEADMDFHWTICSPCCHSLLLDHLRRLQVGTRQFIVCTKFYDSDAESEVESHAPLLRAVLQNEADRAETAMREHITTAGERLLLKMLTNLSGIDSVRRERRPAQ
jgi:DNA-binding GntR family transcriptional regulator